MADTLFLFRPGFVDRGERWFCPYSAQVVGVLAYYPELRAGLDIVELDFPRPRQPMVDLVGPEHQSAPLLVLAPGAPLEVPGVSVGEACGHRFVEKTIEILRYLAVTRGVPAPH
jgi:hypothetical protein